MNLTSQEGKLTKQDYLKFVEQRNAEKLAITKAKNADYTGNNDDPFANFTACERLGAASTEQGFFIRMTDKMMRISSFIQKGVLQVKDESVDDTLKDLANYCDLFAGYLKQQRDANKAGTINISEVNSAESGYINISNNSTTTRRA